MKNAKPYLSISIVILFFVINHGEAQIPKGTIRLGPDINFSSSTTEFDGFDFRLKASSLDLGIQFGYYLIDNFEIGVGLGVSSSKSEVEGLDEETNSGIAVGPAIEYKIGLSPSTYFTLGGGLRYNSAKSDDGSGSDVTYTGLSYQVFGSFEYIVNNKLGAFVGFGPEFGSFKDSDSDSEFDLTTFGVGMGFGFYF